MTCMFVKFNLGSSFSKEIWVDSKNYARKSFDGHKIWDGSDEVLLNKSGGLFMFLRDALPQLQ